MNGPHEGHDGGRIAMTAIDDQVAALRAFLARDTERAIALNNALAEAGRLDGYGELVYSAFTEAVRSRFSPTWTRGQVVQFVASVRGRSAKYAETIRPIIAERLVMSVLGEPAAVIGMSDAEKAVQALLLGELVADEELDDAALEELLGRARERAIQMFT